MLLLGEPVTGKRAAEIDLVTCSFASEEVLRNYVDKVLERLKFCSPASFAETKKCLAATWAGSLELGERVELEAEAVTMATGDFIRGLAAREQGRRFNYYSSKTVDQGPSDGTAD